MLQLVMGFARVRKTTRLLRGGDSEVTSMKESLWAAFLASSAVVVHLADFVATDIFAHGAKVEVTLENITAAFLALALATLACPLALSLGSSRGALERNVLVPLVTIAVARTWDQQALVVLPDVLVLLVGCHQRFAPRHMDGAGTCGLHGIAPNVFL